MDFWTHFGRAADFVSILAALFALFGWIQTRRLNRELDEERARQARLIHVILRNQDNPEEEIRLPISLRRSEVTRSEVLGLIGMARIGGERYELTHITRAAFGADMERIKASATEDTLVIPCSGAEFKQFIAQP